MIKSFAKRERLKVTKDECWDLIVKGKYGHLDEHYDGRIGLVLHRKRANWKNRLKATPGLELYLEGDTEAIFLFSPRNTAFVKSAIRAIGARRKKKLSTEHIEKLRAHLRSLRKPV